ncbi:MAG: hypothetical protein RJA49_2050 [Actinomycetota bacterium]
MAAAPVYFAVAANFHATFTTGVANTDGSGALTAPTWWNAAGIPATDWMLTKLVISSDSATGVGDLADCLVHVFARDPGAGNAVRLIKTIDPGNPAAGSVTLAGYQLELSFGPEYVFQGGTDLRFSVTVTPTAGNVTIFGYAQKL